MNQRHYQKIKQVAAERFSYLNEKNCAYRFIHELRCFKENLQEAALLSDGFSKDDLTHSKKISVEAKHYFFYLNDMTTFLCRLFNIKHVFLRCPKKKYAIIFIGCPSHINAVHTVFKYIHPIMSTLRAHYEEKIKNIKKQEEKDKKVNRFMANWVDSILRECFHDDQGEFHFYEEFHEYVKTHFKTEDDYRDLRMRAADIITVCYDDTLASDITLGDVRKILYDKFTEEHVNKTVHEFRDYLKQEVVIAFGDECEENDDDW